MDEYEWRAGNGLGDRYKVTRQSPNVLWQAPDGKWYPATNELNKSREILRLAERVRELGQREFPRALSDPPGLPPEFSDASLLRQAMLDNDRLEAENAELRKILTRSGTILKEDQETTSPSTTSS